MTVQNYTLAINQGAALSISVSATQGGIPFDLTAYTIAGKIRRKFSDSAALQVLTVTVTDAANGAFTISLTTAETAALTLASTDPNPDARDHSIGVYDIEITTGGVTTRIMQGTVSLSLEATK